MVKGDDCILGAQNKAMIGSLQESVKGLHVRFNNFEKKIDDRITELFNHQSSKVDPSIAKMYGS